jgi:type IV secretory pathway VirB3-like protein
MPEANLFLMFTRRLNALGVAYMVSGSVAVIMAIIYVTQEEKRAWTLGMARMALVHAGRLRNEPRHSGGNLESK